MDLNEFPCAAIITFFPDKSWGSICNIGINGSVLYESRMKITSIQPYQKIDLTSYKMCRILE